MSGFELHRVPENAERIYAPLAPTQTFDHYDPVQLVSQQLTASPTDASEVLDSEFIGFACEPAAGITAASRASNPTNGFGAAENDMRTYLRGNTPGLLLKTKNYWTTPGTQIAKNGNTIGTLHEISAVAATDIWGVESTAGGPGTDATALIEAILDEDGNPIDADTSLTAGEGWIIFRMIGGMQGDVLAGS